MKKFFSIFVLMFVFLLAKPALSLEDDFLYWDVGKDADGEIVSWDYLYDYYSDEVDFWNNFRVRITIFDDDGDLYQEIHYANWLDIDQLANIYVWVGDGDETDDWDFWDIEVHADTRIMFEITLNGGREWILSSVKSLSSVPDVYEMFDILYWGFENIVKSDDNDKAIQKTTSWGKNKTAAMRTQRPKNVHNEKTEAFRQKLIENGTIKVNTTK